MNPETNSFEQLNRDFDQLKRLGESRLVRPNGEPVPAHWPVFEQGELVVLKDYTFKVGYIGEKCLVLEPAGIVEVNHDHP